MKKGNVFDHIDNLDELKPYICPKAVSVGESNWINVCMECKGKCDAGKRAIELLNIANKPYFPEKNGGPGIVTAKMLAGRDAWNELQHVRVIALIRKVFSEVTNNDRNPAEVLAEIEGIDAILARKRIDYWIKKYPDLDKELNMKAIMDRYVKRRKSRKAKPVEVLPEPDTDEISIGDILKAADTKAHIEAAQKQVNEVLTQRDAVTLSEFREKIGLDPLRPDEYPLVGEGGFTVDNKFPCEAAPVPFSPSQMFPDGKGGFRVVGDIPKEGDSEDNPFHEEDRLIPQGTARKLLMQFAEDCDAGAVHLPRWGDTKTQHDNVNRPGHYTFGAIEVIDYIRDKMTPEMFQGFCMGNVLKYVSRHKHKNGIEDLKKANVYLGWLIESEEGAE